MGTGGGGGTNFYLAQKIVFSSDSSSLYDFVLGRGQGYSTLASLVLKRLERASNKYFLSQFHAVILLYWQIHAPGKTWRVMKRYHFFDVLENINFSY